MFALSIEHAGKARRMQETIVTLCTIGDRVSQGEPLYLETAQGDKLCGQLV